MKKWNALILVMLGEIAGHAQENSWKNRISADMDGRLKYERLLPFGFNIGTDWKYRYVIEGTKYFHADQQPDIWLLTISHSLRTKLVEWENKVSFINRPINFSTIKFNSNIRKVFSFEERWGISPFIGFFEYRLDPGAYGSKWWQNDIANHLEFRTKLGLDIQLYFQK